jgi:hypothetical protein
MIGARLGKCDGARLMGGNDVGMSLGIIDTVGELDGLLGLLVGFIDTVGDAVGSTELPDNDG